MAQEAAWRGHSRAEVRGGGWPPRPHLHTSQFPGSLTCSWCGDSNLSSFGKALQMWRVFFFFFSHRPEGRQRGGRTTEGAVPAGGQLGNSPPHGMQGHSGTRCCPLPPKCPSTFQVLSEEAGPGLPVTFPEADSRGNPGPLAVRGYTQLGAPEPALHRTGDWETVATGPWPPNRPSNGGGGSCPGGSHAKSPRLPGCLPWAQDFAHVDP